jgi:hypothetical protein
VVEGLRRSGANVKVRRQEGDKSEIAIWASAWMGGPDGACNLGYFQAVCAEMPVPDVLTAANRARKEYRWVPYPYSGPTGELLVVSADARGLVMSNDAFLRWNEAAEQAGKLEQVEGLEGADAIIKQLTILCQDVGPAEFRLAGQLLHRLKVGDRWREDSSQPHTIRRELEPLARLEIKDQPGV